MKINLSINELLFYSSTGLQQNQINLEKLLNLQRLLLLKIKVLQIVPLVILKFLIKQHNIKLDQTLFENKKKFQIKN